MDLHIDTVTSNLSSNNCIRLAQINVRHCSAAVDEVSSLFLDGGFSILAVQECYNLNGIPHGFPSESRVVFSGSNPSVCFIIDLSLPFSLIKEYSNSHIIIIESLLNNSPFFIINCYIQPALNFTNFLNNLDNLLSSIHTHNYIILGDFNSRSTLWGDTLTNERGTLFSELILKYSLLIHNSKHSGPTFSSSVGSSVIDLTLSKLKDFSIFNWAINRDLSVLSDHFFITFSLCLNSSPHSFPPVLSQRENLFYNFGKSKWSQLKHFINTPQFISDFHSCFDDKSPSLSLEHFHSLIDDLLGRFVPRGSRRKFNHWWSHNLTLLKANVRSKFKKFLKSRSVADHLAYKAVRNSYVSSIKRHKCDWLLSNDLREVQTGRSPWGKSFKHCFQKISPNSYPSISSLSNNCTIDSLNNLLNEAFPDDSLSSDTSLHSNLRIQFKNFSFPHNSTTDQFPISLSEISSALDRLKAGKSAGLDGIKNCFWRNFFLFNNNLLFYLFNFCFRTGYFPARWKSASITFIPKSSGTALRPISILPSIGKIYEHILNIRLRSHAESESLISKYQFGFCSGKSTLNALHYFHQSYLEFNSCNYILAAFLDISKAFDSAWWPGIHDILLHSNCPPPLLSAIHSFFSERTVLLSFGSITVSKTLSLGCPQGSVLSPLLWNIFFNSIFDISIHRYMRIIAYADDVSIIAAHVSPSLCESLLSDFMCKLCLWSFEKKISFSTTKSVILKLKGSPSWVPSVSMKDILLPVVSEYKFLGIVFSKNLHFHKHLNFKLQKCEKQAHMFFRLLKSNKALTVSNMTRIYTSVIIPSLSYGVFLWFRTASLPSNAKKLISLQRKCFLAISGCFRTTSSAALDILMGLLPIMIVLEAFNTRESLRIAGSSQFNGFSFSALTNNLIQARDAESGCRVLSRPEFVNLTRSLSFQLWESQWALSSTGRFTFLFFSSVSSRLSRPWFKARGPLARFISGHSLCELYLKRFNLVSRRFCTCEHSPGDLLHDLFYCRQFSKINFSSHDYDPSVLTSEPLYSDFLKFAKLRESLRRFQLSLTDPALVP